MRSFTDSRSEPLFLRDSTLLLYGIGTMLLLVLWLEIREIGSAPIRHKAAVVCSVCRLLNVLP